ncbi:pitrilysin family protein [uncultured Microscilla sp.]|uniref:M16 family metallopeptidase n=1 Tax=uncultured Microscilla sp. TaxID=432653 RepID=UPI00263A2B1D|nr:pitrilysin family protein [uncultured Microscilla sp.]
MDTQCKIHTLDNGIRIVHREVGHTKVAHCGFVLDIGSRDEKPHQLGIAHFWEHMAFKGTNKRKAYHIINRLEAVGGELNAYTTKEQICFYASLLDKHYEKAVELLADITFDSVFPENQIERERNVILEEMAMYRDSPEDALQDEFDAVVFRNHPLGYNILGTSESVGSFHRQDFQAFIQENIDTSRIVFSSVGNLPFGKVLKIASKYLDQVPAASSKPCRQSFESYHPHQIKLTHTAQQAYCALGRPTYHRSHPKKLPFFMLNNILGGPGMNSRLNLSLREKHGWVYSVESNYHPFSDTGLFAIYFATERKHFERSIALVMKQLKLLKVQALGKMQLHSAKEQLFGQLAMAEENNLNFMLMMGKSILDSSEVESLEVIFENIRKITASDLMEVANEMLNEDDLSIFRYLPG